MITGGLGRIGFNIAAHIAELSGATLVLMGRSAMPKRAKWAEVEDEGTLAKIEKIKYLESLGSKVIYQKVNLSDGKAAKKAFQNLGKIYKKIDGIYHATAVIDSNSFHAIPEISLIKSQEHFEGKVRGTMALAEALEGVEYGYCLLMSSISSVLGGIGFASYA